MEHAAIITGASQGIGQACALELAPHFDVIVLNSYQHPENLRKVSEQVEQLGTKCITYTGDVGDFTFVHTMMTELQNTPLQIDLLVNNAGISYIGLLTDMTIQDWNQIVATNLTSLFNCCNQIVPHMVRNKSGHIINISSIWGISGASCEVAYSATKGGMNAFTRALAKELAPSSIRVNAIACGVIDTPMNSCFNREELGHLCDEIPACRLGQPEEIAQLVRQLYEGPSYLTGEIIKADGGYL